MTAYPAPNREDFFSEYEPPQTRSLSEEEVKARRQRQESFNVAARHFSRALLVVATVVGVAGILLGSIIALPSVGVGLMLGGTFTIGVGYWWYSNLINDWWRFGSLLIGFAVLLFVGYRLHERRTA